MPTKKIKSNPSVLKGEATFRLDERTQKAFAKLVQRTKKQKFNPNNHSQIVICGSEEFEESEKARKIRK